MVLGKTLESPLDSKGLSNQAILKEINPEYSLEETLMLERQEEKGVTEDEMVGWHYQFDGHEFEQTPGDSGGERNMACCSS